MEDNKKKKVKKVGNKTFGVLIILLGIIIIASFFGMPDILRYSYVLWPVFLIGLGCEVLYYDIKDDVDIKWSFGNVFMTGILLVCAFIFGMIGSTFNYIKKNETIKTYIDYKIEEKIHSDEEFEEYLEKEKENEIEILNENK